MAENQPSGPPGPDVTGAPKVLGITGALYAVALILCIGRMYTRLRQRNLWWDDYTMVAAFILALAEWALFLASSKHGAGRHNYYIPHQSQIEAQHLLYASTLPWAPSMMFIKISIACMLLRIRHTRQWLIFLWSMIAIQIASCIASLVFQLVQCIPMGAIWNPEGHPNATCAKPQSAFISLYVNSAISIATDLIFAAVPFIFIRRMQRPLRERIILSCLMGMGVFAAAASIVKTTLVPYYGITGDSLWDAIDLTLWSILEEQVGIIAACIPCLKSPFERTLHRIGFLSRMSSTVRHSNPRRRHYSATLTTSDSHKMAKMQAMSHGNTGIGVGISAGRSDAQSEVTLWPITEDEKSIPGLPPPNIFGGIVKTTELRVSSENIPRVEMEMRPSGEGMGLEENSPSWQDGDSSHARGGWNAV